MARSYLWRTLLMLLAGGLLFESTLTFGSTKPIRLESPSIKDGLSQATANSVFQNSCGFRWIGTEDGVCCTEDPRCRKNVTALEGDGSIWSNAFSQFDGDIWSSGLTDAASINSWVDEEQGEYHARSP